MMDNITNQTKLDFVENFYAKLPHKPYCSDDLGYGVIIRPKNSNSKTVHPIQPLVLSPR